MQGPNHVIRTTEFSIQPREDAETNPGVFGRALADYLAAQIRSRGVDVEGVIPEDFGYCIILKRKPLRLWIACGNRAGRIDEWIAFAVAEGALRGRFVGNIHPALEVDRISEMLGEIMRTAPGVESYSLETD
jgi:hypothetical protein